jgi:PAS domain S-box-containing protein
VSPSKGFRQKARINLAPASKESYTDLEKKVEARTEELRLSQEAERQLVEENAILIHIGQIMSSTLDIDEVYDQFAQEVKKLVPFDRMSINVIDYAAGTFVFRYATGLIQPGRHIPDVIPLAGTLTEHVIKTGQPTILFSVIENPQFSGVENFLNMGLRSVIMLPLSSKGKIIGTLSLRSQQVGAYGAREQTILERLANQIAPAVANAELYDQARRVEMALRESERRYRDLVDKARDVIYTVAPDGTITSLNPIFETITGWKCEEWIGKSFIALVHPDDLSFVIEQLQHALQGEAPSPFEHRVLTKSGEYLIGEFLETPLFQDGQVVSVSGIARDITARKRAEEALRCSEEKYRTLFEQSKDAIFIALNAKVVDANQAALDLFGYTREEAIGLDVEKVYANADDDRLRFRGEIEKYGSVKDFELRLKKKDGTIIDCLLTATLRQGDDGSLLETQGIIRDVTEHKQAEEALRQSEDRFRRAQQAGRLGTWDWDLNTNQFVWDGSPLIQGVELCDSDQGVEPGHGNQPCDFDRFFDNYLKNVHPDDRDMFIQKCASATEQGTDLHVEYRLVWPDGSVHWIEEVGQAYQDDSGRTIRMTGTCQDITERKEAEETQLQQTRELAVLGERNRMAREIHDTLAQGFTGIILQLEAAEQAQEGHPADVAEHIDRAKNLARNSLQEARRSVWNLLPHALEQLPLDDALREEVSKFNVGGRPKASFELMGKRKELSSEAQTALLRICQESLSNIKKYANATEVSVTLTYTSEAAYLNVKDDGEGFDPAQLSGMSEQGGFGLTGMEQRAKLLKGTLEVKSHRGKGTLVEAKIPIP